jgi:type II secretory pathway predicted ATPase ExeA
MYESHYGLKEKPFSLLPDPDYLMLGSKHKMAYNLLEYGLDYSDGFTIISGEVGCGKTTLIQQLLKNTGTHITFALISDTIRLQGEILERVLMAYGLETAAHNDKWTDKFKRFREFAIDEYSQGRRLVIIIDEAQGMDVEALEELRVLSNINIGKNLLVQIILSGQPELRAKLSDPKLKQFAQRIGKLYHLMPLSHTETIEYIHHRITVAGGNPNLFTDEACEIVFVSSSGVPRVINQLCDSALVYGYGMDKKQIDRHVLAPVLSDQVHAWTVTPKTSPPNSGDLALIHKSVDESSLNSSDNHQRVYKLPLQQLDEPQDPVQPKPEAVPESYEILEDETLSFNAHDLENNDTATIIRGMYYISASDFHRQHFGLPISGSVSNIEWLDIVCENERERVKNLFAQYLDQDLSSFTVTTTIEDSNEKRTLVNLAFEVSENDSSNWLKKGRYNQSLILNIENRLTSHATNNG